MSDIFREVDEDVRRDSAAALWQKYSIVVYGFAFLIVALTAAYRGYEYWHTKQAETAGAQFEAAVDLAQSGKVDEAKAALEKLRAEGPMGYALLSRFQIAALTAKTDAVAGAKAYDAIADDTSVEATMRDTARLQSALLNVDSLSTNDLQSRLAPLTIGTNPFRNSARELLGLSALKANDFDNAGRWFDAIVTDAGAPQGIRARADAFLGLVKSAKPVPKPAG